MQAPLPQIGARINEVAPNTTVADFVDHVGHIVSLFGLEHVGISSDFDGDGGLERWKDALNT